VGVFVLSGCFFLSVWVFLFFSGSQVCVFVCVCVFGRFDLCLGVGSSGRVGVLV